MEKFTNYWFNWLMGCMATLLAAAWGWVVKKYITLHKQTEANNQGTLALLKDRLFERCQFYITRGWCSPTEREALESLHAAYTTMGGNGTGTDLYNAVRALPFNKGGESHE